MPIKPGTKPNDKNFAHVSEGEMMRGLQLAKHVVKQKNFGHRTVWYNQFGEKIASHTVHRRSSETLLHVKLKQLLDEKRAKDLEERERLEAMAETEAA